METLRANISTSSVAVLAKMGGIRSPDLVQIICGWAEVLRRNQYGLTLFACQGEELSNAE
jgi:hypothetical protein